MAPQTSSSQALLFSSAKPVEQLGSAAGWTSPPTLADLAATDTLVPTFNDIRGFIAANGEGLTRDDAILEELSKLLHAKVFDETSASAEQALRFYALEQEPKEAVRHRILALYVESLNGESNGVSVESAIRLDDGCLVYSVQALQRSRLSGAGRDVVGEAYESFIFPALRGGQGQFFTPRNVGTCMAALLNIQSGDRVVDPACGPGGFLSEVHALASSRGLDVELFGVDKDDLLVRLATDSLRARDVAARIGCGNSLAPWSTMPSKTRGILQPGSFDVVITNPPFGAKIPVTGDDTLRQFDMAKRWTYSRRKESWIARGDLKPSMPPQILFVERCWQLLKDGGRCAIVLPEGVLGNKSQGYLRQWLAERADIVAVIDCPLETFLPSTSTKTVILVFQRRKRPSRPPVFMAVAEVCGHDRRGKPLMDAEGKLDDDFPRIAGAWQEAQGVA